MDQAAKTPVQSQQPVQKQSVLQQSQQPVQSLVLKMPQSRIATPAADDAGLGRRFSTTVDVPAMTDIERAEPAPVVEVQYISEATLLEMETGRAALMKTRSVPRPPG